MICTVCGAQFSSEEHALLRDTLPFGDREIEQAVGVCCPICASEAICQSGECAECGGEFSQDELDTQLCRLCVAALTESLDWMWEQLSDAQKQWAIAHPTWMER